MTAGSPLAAVASWGFPACAGWLSDGPGGPAVQEVTGPADRDFEWASVTKVLTALTIWVAVEEGTVSWDDPAGPEGSTLRHLLAHASGLAPDGGRVLDRPGRRRIYSNTGIEVAADHLARASGLEFEVYAREAVLDPLGMASTRLAGSPAWDGRGPLRDLLALAAELLRPRLVNPTTLAAVSAVAFPGLGGVLPGFGRQATNDWGLGVEVRDHKRPHWTGTLNSPATFGHFGRSGSLLWVDPRAGRALVALAAQPFGAWAQQAWPALSDAVLEA